MERAKHNEYYASILAVVLLLAPQLSFARGMSGGAAGRAGGFSFSSVPSRSVSARFSGRMASSQPHVLIRNPRSGAFMAARNPNSLDPRSIQPFMTVGAARTSARSSFSPVSPNGHHVDFRHRPRIIINRWRASVIVVPFQPYFGYYSYCNSFYYGDYGCPPPYTQFAPVYVPVPVPYYSDENPYAVDNSVGLPADNGDYTPPSGTTDPAAVSSEPFDRQGDYAFHARDYMAATRAWQHAVVDDPGNGALAMKLALALFAVGKYREAAGTTQQVLMLLPQEKWDQAVSDYKKLYANPKDYLDQLKNLANAAADKPNDPALRFLLGFHYGYSGRVVDAVRELNKLVQLAPKDQLGHKLRGLMADKAHKDNNSAVAMAPSDIYVRKGSNGTLYFSNVPTDLSYQPLTWRRTPLVQNEKQY
jgi:Flp pilus assembly protein TadD